MHQDVCLGLNHSVLWKLEQTGALKEKRENSIHPEVSRGYWNTKVKLVVSRVVNGDHFPFGYGLGGVSVANIK